MATQQGRHLDVDVIGERAIAQIIDGIVQVILVFGIAFVGGFVLPESVGAVVVLLAVVAFVGYNFVLEYYWDGQTVGKRLMNIRVVDEQGNDADLGKIVVRNIPAVIHLGLFSIIAALLSMSSSDKKQRLFDRVAGTIVVSVTSSETGTTTHHSDESTTF